MPPVIAHEPSQLSQGVFQYLSGFGEAKRRYEEERARQQAISRQQTANAVGGAVGDIGAGYFRGREKQFNRDEADRIRREQNQFRLTLEQQDQDLRSFGLPTQQIEDQALQLGVDSSQYRDQLRQQRIDQTIEAKMTDDLYEWKYTPADDRRIREIQDKFDEVNARNAPYMPEEQDAINEQLIEQMSSIKMKKMPRTTPKPQTWEEKIQAGQIIEEDIPGGKIIKSFDRSGAPRTDHIKYDTGNKSVDGFNINENEWMEMVAEARHNAGHYEWEEKPAPTEKNPKAVSRKRVWIDADQFDPKVDAALDMELGRRKKLLEKHNARVTQPQQGALPSSGATTFGPGAMGQPPQDPRLVPQSMPPLQFQQPQQGPATGFLGTPEKAMEIIQGALQTQPDPAQWPPEVKEQLRPAAETIQSDIMQKLGGDPTKATPDMLETLLMLKAILE